METLLGAFANRLRLSLFMSALIIGAIPFLSNARSPSNEQRHLANQLRNGPGTTNHPVGVIPSNSIAIPDGWPVDHDGTITCLTCHEQLPLLQGGGDPYLREFERDGVDSAGFCMNCHAQGNRSSAASMHWMGIGPAHIKPELDRAAYDGGLLDVESRRCVNCHDGITASEAQHMTSGQRRRGYSGDPQRNHLIGVRYQSRQSRKFKTPLRPASLLPKGIRLPGGEVSCVSCHNLYNTERFRLSVPIEGSQLCFACHQMD